MRISHSLAFVSSRPTVVALGFFDGVHLGHRAVIEEARHRAAELSCDCAVFTFSQLPKEILSPGSVRMITDGEDRAEAIRSLRDAPETQKNMRQTCRRIYLENYTTEICTQKYVTLFRSLL